MTATLRAVAVSALLATTLAIGHLATESSGAELAFPLSTIDRHIGPWQATADKTLDGAVLKILQPSEYISRIYESPDSQVALLVLYFSRHRAGQTMHSPLVCLPGSGWEIWRREDATFGDGAYPINKLHIHNSGQRMVVLYWYQTPDRVIRGEYMNKLLLVGNGLLGKRTDAALVRLIVPDRPEAVQQAMRFASQALPQIERCFGSAPAHGRPVVQ